MKTLIWAPVNCGYDAVHYPKGKYYQWGRKDGQSYGTSNRKSANSDSYSNPDKDTYYTNWNFSEDWTGDNNPCPDGWRVPTKDELSALRQHYKKYGYTPRGTWFSGAVEYSHGVSNAIFLDAAGCNIPSGAGYQQNNEVGYYWTSTIDGDNREKNYVLSFNSTLTSNSTPGINTYYTEYNSKGRTSGCTIRCVK
jgi:uncharacterized protein (TIGR02145 family)